MKKSIFTLLSFALSIGTVFSQLIFSEIMYNPAPGSALDEQDYEFLEIANIGSSAVNVSGYTFTDGIAYTFPANSIIGANERILLVRNQAIFSQRYPEATVFGVYASGLSNSGETLTLVDLTLNSVIEITYNDASPWPVLADGQGFSLVPVDESSSLSLSSPEYWTTSNNINGSPGKKETLTVDTYEVYVNELLSSPSLGNLDKVELYNNSDDTVNIGNWYLTDDRKSPKQYKITANTKIAPKDYLVLDENAFNLFGLGFSFSKDGEEVFLFAANASNQLTGYSHGFSFMAQLEDVSFGRIVTSDGREHFVRQTEQTFGAVNAGPQVGPIVIEKIMYNPDALTDEFLVLTNISNERVELATTELVDSNVYRVEGISFKFPEPSSTFLEAGQSLVLTSLAASDFRTKYKLASTMPVFQYTGALNNSGEKLTIETPIYRDTLPDNSFDNHYMVIDEVNYLPSAPWPIASSASKKYLQRSNLNAFGSEPQNWFASDEQIIAGLFSSYNTEPASSFAYPTRVVNVLNLENKDIIKLSIMDVMGRERLQFTDLNYAINLNNLEPGMYILNGTTASNEVLTMKIIKE